MKISVLTPSFNSSEFIQRAIDSVVTQSYTNWQHIVVDGRSTDQTLEILKSNNHLLWISEDDKGQSDAMNKAFELSDGSIIVYLNSDDYFLPDAFEFIISQFKASSVQMIVGNVEVLDSNGNSQISTNATISYDDIQYLKGRYPLNPVGYFYKRDVQEKIGPFPLDNHYSMDYWFLLRAYYNFKILKVNRTLGVFDQHGNNKTSLLGDRTFYIQQKQALIFSLKYNRRILPKVYWALLTHSRNRRLHSRLLKRILRIAKIKS